MKWPSKTERENLEISGFTEAYARLPEARELEVVSKGERPDYIVKDRQTGEEYGVELTSAYVSDRSVPDAHMRDEEGPVGIPDDKVELETYTKRLVGAIVDKVCKARKGFDLTRPLILAIHVNEYISIYLGEREVQEFARRYEGLFDAMTPFTQIVFWNLSNDGAFRVRPRLPGRQPGPAVYRP